MMAAHVFDLKEVPVKTPQAVADLANKRIDLPAHLRQLLVMTNGRLSIAQLLSIGIRGVSMESFTELHSQGLISSAATGAPSAESSKDVPNPAVVQAPALGGAKGLSETRFAVIDLLLDHSTRDFAFRPWVDRAERATSRDELRALAEQLGSSALGKQHANLAIALLRVTE